MLKNKNYAADSAFLACHVIVETDWVRRDQKAK
jgi:hypothetical protein